MDPFVINQVANSRKGLAASMAEVGPLSCMGPHVDYHVGLFGKFLATTFVTALEPL